MKTESVNDILIKLGVSPNLKGFTYIVDAILLLDQPEWKNPKWYSLYYCIGQLHQTNAAAVEASIRHTLKRLRNHNYDYKQVDYYFGFCNCDNASSLMQFYLRLCKTEKQQNNNYNKLLLKQALTELLT